MNAGRCFVQTVGVLVAFTIVRTFGLLGAPAVATGLLMAALIIVAWDGGLTRDDLGLGWNKCPRACDTAALPSGSSCWCW